MDSYRQISRIFFFTVIPVIVSSGVYNINSVIDNGIMAHGMESLGRGKEFLALWGIYNNKYMLLVHVPLAMANSLSSSLIPSLSGAIARKDRKAAIEKTALRSVCYADCDSVGGGAGRYFQHRSITCYSGAATMRKRSV